MFYPGQIVYIESKDELAMFLGIVPGKYNSSQKNDDFEVFLHDSLDPKLSGVELFELDDVKFLMEPADTLTKTQIYYGPKKDGRYVFRKKSWDSKISNDELNVIEADVIKLMDDLRKEEWVKDYFRDRRPKTEENTQTV